MKCIYQFLFGVLFFRTFYVFLVIFSFYVYVIYFLSFWVCNQDEAFFIGSILEHFKRKIGQTHRAKYIPQILICCFLSRKDDNACGTVILTYTMYIRLFLLLDVPRESPSTSKKYTYTITRKTWEIVAVTHFACNFILLNRNCVGGKSSTHEKLFSPEEKWMTRHKALQYTTYIE